MKWLNFNPDSDDFVENKILSYFYNKTKNWGPWIYQSKWNVYAEDLWIDTRRFELTVRELARDEFIDNRIQHWDTSIVLAQKGRIRARNFSEQRILVKRNNSDGDHEEDAKKPYIEIKAYKFNPEIHTYLPLRNWWVNVRKKVGWMTVDINNPWFVRIGSGVIVGVVLYLLFWR